MRFHDIIAVAWLALACALAPAHAERRVALVIGNDRYVNLPASEQLQKAVNDAHAIGSALKQIGFEVIAGENLGRRAVLARIDAAAQRLTAGDTVFFFFSGHGVAVDGFNYILPADVPAVRNDQITSLTGAAIKEEDITTAFLRAGARVAVVVLDACRNNPFAASGTKGIGGEKGLAPHEPPRGVFTFYAASRGEAALDRIHDDDRDPNSVFTRVLLPVLTRPDLDLPALAREVREEVTRLARSVNHAQRPAYYDETSGDRIFLAALPPGTGRPGSGAPSPGAGVPKPPADPVEVAAPPAATPQVTLAAPPVAPADPTCSGPVTASFPSRCAAPLTAEQERGLKPKNSFRECENCPEMVVVPAGSFTMGSPEGEKERYVNEGPQHMVTIGKPFAVAKLHVTRDQFAAFVKETGYVAYPDCSWSNPGFPQEGTHPVVCVNWDDANAYANWLSTKTGKTYRLLTEAEWEYAARGRTSPGKYPRFWSGDSERDLCRYGNFWDQKAAEKNALCNDGYDRTSPAGHYEPNAFGLYDMFGNVRQWTADCYHDSYIGAPSDGSAWIKGCYGSGRVVRGGSWYGSPRWLRSARRFALTEEDDKGGFRLARTLAP